MDRQAMDDTRQRLVRCFATVFPELSDEAVYAASQATLPAWDSVAAITLVNVIEEEFGIQMDFEDLENLTSFERVWVYLQQTHALPR
jgi:acyl carrier protein